jgi:hypothetical protein
VTYFHSIETLADTGYATGIQLIEHEGDVVGSFQWSGDGTGAGTLILRGDEHYVATIRATFQQNGLLRRCTSAVGVNTGQLDLGVVDAAQ